MSVLRSLYASLTWVGVPLIYSYLHLRAKRGKEDLTRLSERKGYASRQRDMHRPLIWVHAISVGEANSALALINELSEIYPHVQILMTTGTVASAQVMAQWLPECAFHQYVPVDTPQAVKRFIDYWQPDLGIWVESEIWPNLIYKAHEESVPLVMLNGRISGKSFERWLKAQGFIDSLLKNFSLCGVQTTQQKEFFTRLGAPNVKVLPNLKLLAKPKESDPELYGSLKESVAGRPVFFAASTHHGEEAFVVDIHERLTKIFPDLLTVIAPRHVNRLPDVETLLVERHKKFGRLSTYMPQRAHEFFVVDRMGVMEPFYALADAVFVGATWVNKGGHNPIEPAQFDCHLVFGPHTYTNQDLFDLIEDIGIGHKVHSIDEAVKVLSAQFETHEHPAHEPFKLQAMREEGMTALVHALKPFLPSAKKEVA